ncbi:hypothetical protein BN7_6007 [Wickerhamomyces ciferrii]|uniref:Uncharacterized protein n=1 Tax=Wickerhamomyces ciferrii (strain ATCC 14091 / BCRC 22168 / CBS 111 / JCM 3599 / NBRC 0793 / NRRL Y-1031 F-60-10) TaxID=1206466 RepID=K0KZ67_WICCF|nr:uncharacterized protein BN7_6007 [Wickerhamomyces ciferrii]CCH46413.1 hypothetical protein BN7_6007 [Wickerhamomyces ciferrii]
MNSHPDMNSITTSIIKVHHSYYTIKQSSQVKSTMQLFKLVSIATLAQSILCADLNPTTNVVPQHKSLSAKYRIIFKSNELNSDEGTFSIKAKINNNEENVDLFIAKKSNVSSTNLTPSKEIKFDSKLADAVLDYKSNGDEEITFEIKGYSDPLKNVAGTSVDFSGFYQPKVDGSAIELPFEVSAVL